MKIFPKIVTILIPALAFAHTARAQSVLEQLEQELQQSSGSLLRCVVTIEWQDDQLESQPLAVSGVVVDDQGSILTTGLPSRAKGGRLRAADSRGREIKPRWLGFDRETGITLLTIEPGRLEAAPYAEDVPEIGAWTILIGSPDGMRHSIRYGNISGAGREVQIQGRLHSDLIEFSTSLRPGDSGAVLANRRGEMVGIVRSGLTRADTTNSNDPRPSGIGFAIPAATARHVANHLRAHGRVQRGFLGIDADEPPRGTERGAYVLKVYPGTPAAEAGLKAGDLVVTIDGQPARSFLDLARTIEKSPPGTRIRLGVARSGEQIDLEVVLAEKPDAPAVEAIPPLPGFAPGNSPRSERGILLGIEVQGLTSDLRDALSLPDIDGTIITVVAPGTPAEEAGLKAFDVITAVDDTPVRTPDDLIEAIQQAGPGGAVTLKILRGKEPKAVAVTLREQRQFDLWEHLTQAPRFTHPLDQRHDELQRRVEALERRIADLERLIETPDPQK